MVIKGIAASSGYAIAKALKIEHKELDTSKKAVTDVEAEYLSLENAVEASKQDLTRIRAYAAEKLGEDKAQIFDAHLLVAEDPEMMGQVKEVIKNESANAAYALKTVADQFILIFESMDNEYMAERAADIKDVTTRILKHLLGIKIADLSQLDEEVIIVCEDLTPSDTAQLNKAFAKGFATNIGGRTSHSAIMARSMEIPAVVGTKTVLEDVVDGDMLLLDGIAGKIIVNPTEEVLAEYKVKMDEYEEQKAIWAQFKDKDSFTKDGHQVELVANIGTPADVDGIIENGGEGVGLYRTEFLYMNRDNFPNEEEQFNAYKEVLERLEGKPCVIRTLDIGGDKHLSYWKLPEEMNPFLGYRAIRLCLDQRDIFKIQLRALLRASVYGNLKIMFPMIATINEFKDAKAFLLEVKEELLAEGVEVSDSIEVGMMVEIPATAVIAKQFAKYVDFFSIGTNDLIQYTMAADRMNEQVSYLYQPYNPSILNLVANVIEAAHAQGKWVGMCGEMAGDQTAFPILLGLGLDEFSMSATSILPSRYLASRLNVTDMQEMAQKALECDTQEEVVALVEQYTK
jgi:phosphotransferase system enzyme I (PtsI)